MPGPLLFLYVSPGTEARCDEFVPLTGSFRVARYSFVAGLFADLLNDSPVALVVRCESGEWERGVALQLVGYVHYHHPTIVIAVVGVPSGRYEEFLKNNADIVIEEGEFDGGTLVQSIISEHETRALTPS